MNRPGPRGVVLLALALSVAAFAAERVDAAPRRPACTRSALQAGIARARGVRVVRPFGCDGVWAYSAVLIGTGRHQVEGTAVFSAHGTRWVAVSRERPCARDEIPARIRHAACDSN